MVPRDSDIPKSGFRASGLRIPDIQRWTLHVDSSLH